MTSQHYTDFLQEEIDSRKLRNPRYSERAFARSIALSPGFLKLVLQKKKALSIKRAEQIAVKFPWPVPKKRQFLEMVKRHSLEKITPPSKIFAFLFSNRDRLYAGEGSLTRLDDGTAIPYQVTTQLGAEDDGSTKTILTRYEYATGLSYELDLQFLDSGGGTFLVQIAGNPAGKGFFVGKICHVDVDFIHPQLGPFRSSVSYVFSGERIVASGRNYTSNTTFQQTSKAVRKSRKKVNRKPRR